MFKFYLNIYLSVYVRPGRCNVRDVGHIWLFGFPKMARMKLPVNQIQQNFARSNTKNIEPSQKVRMVVYMNNHIQSAS